MFSRPKIAEKIQPQSERTLETLRRAIARVPWNQVERSDKRNVHAFKSTVALHLREIAGNATDPCAVIRTISDQTICRTTLMASEFVEVVEEINALIDSKCDWDSLGKVMIVRMNPQSTVPLHVDTGEYFKRYDRIHLPVATDPSIIFFGAYAEETIHMQAGFVWRLLNSRPHGVHNPSQNFRTHIIFDVLKPYMKAK